MKNALLTTALLLAALTPLSAQESATDLLSKATDAFQRNQTKESHWTWTVEERAFTHDTAGKTIQEFPMVKVESVIRSDGHRCEAIVSWSDGWEPYPEGADNDTRCQIVEIDFDLPGMALQKLLKSRVAEVAEQGAGSITIAISPDKHLPSSDPLAKCAAAMRGTVHLDRATFSPKGFGRRSLPTVADSGGAATNFPWKRERLSNWSTLYKKTASRKSRTISGSFPASEWRAHPSRRESTLSAIENSRPTRRV